MTIINEVSRKHKNTKMLELDKNIIRDPLLYMSALNNTETTVLRILFSISSTHKEVYVSQNTIADWTSLTRRQINRVISKLASLGIIKKIYREYNTCIYLINDFFKQTRTKNLLKRIIPAIMGLTFSVSTLFSVPMKVEKMDSKFKKPRTYSAGYHRLWVEGQTDEYKPKQTGFKHISEVNVVNNKYSKTNHVNKTNIVDNTYPKDNQPDTKIDLMTEFKALSTQVNKTVLEQVESFDLKTKVKVLKNYIIGQKLIESEFK